MLVSLPAFSAAAWYTGNINRLWPDERDGGFIITFSPPSTLSDCKHNYAYARPSLQPERLKNSFALAMSAFHTGALVGVVIDKGQPDDYCYVLGIDLRK